MHKIKSYYTYLTNKITKFWISRQPITYYLDILNRINAIIPHKANISYVQLPDRALSPIYLNQSEIFHNAIYWFIATDIG